LGVATKYDTYMMRKPIGTLNMVLRGREGREGQRKRKERKEDEEIR